MNNFLQRTITGAGYVMIIVLSLIVHPLSFAGLSVVLNLLALAEFRKLDKTLSAESPLWLYLTSLFMLLSLVLSYTFSEPGISLSALLIMVIFLFIYSLYRNTEKNWNFLVKSVFAIIYISLPLTLLTLLHYIYDVNQGLSLVLILFILIWTNDSFAYVFGMLFGKHRLFERISPKKSWEGFFGGLIITILAAYLLSFFNDTLSLPEWIVLALLSVLAGVFGDFTESILKRSVHVKDSGSLLPGHGGILDRIDSLLLVSPVICAYLFILNLLSS